MELAAVGGGARSARGLQLKADIIGRPIMTLAVREAACLAAAMLAATAAGEYASIQEAVKATTKPARIFTPDPAMKKKYDERFSLYQQLYPTLRPLAAKM
jgi:xylulokinase